MKKTQRIIIGLGLIAIFGYAISTLEFAPAPVDYQASIEMKRAETKQFFANSSESPVKNLKGFPGLAFFAIDPAFKVEASLELFDNPQSVLIASSKDQPQSYLKFARANFTLQGKQHQLLLLKETLQDPFLFLAFSDQTSGSTTYGGGRYLNVPYKRGDQKVMLDFNLAYHPYCVYNAEYVCPLPPPENHLTVAIEAGEKLNDEK